MKSPMEAAAPKTLFPTGTDDVVLATGLVFKALVDGTYIGELLPAGF